jgi:hypothetical protein
VPATKDSECFTSESPAALAYGDRSVHVLRDLGLRQGTRPTIR